MDLIYILLQASEETGHKRSTRATIEVTVSGTNNFDPVVTSSSGNFIGTISEDADAGTPLRSQGSTDAIQLVVTDQDVVGFFFCLQCTLKVTCMIFQNKRVDDALI